MVFLTLSKINLLTSGTSPIRFSKAGPISDPGVEIAWLKKATAIGFFLTSKTLKVPFAISKPVSENSISPASLIL